MIIFLFLYLDFLVPDIGVYNDEDESGGEEIEEGDGEDIGSEQEIDGEFFYWILFEKPDNWKYFSDDEDLEEEAEDGE